jgi:hypothetical protein
VGAVVTSKRAEKRLIAAEVAFEARLNRDFGDGYMDAYIADACVDGIACLRRPAGSLDEYEVHAFLKRVTFDYLASAAWDVAIAEDEAEMRELLVAAIELVDDFEMFVELVIGPTTFLAGCSSEDYAVMTAGSIETYAISRNGKYATFDTGSEDGFPYYLMSGPVDGAPGAEDVAAAVASFGGPGPGVSATNDFEVNEEALD